MEWGDALMRRRNSPRGFQQARVIFDAAREMLGKRPASMRAARAGDAARPVGGVQAGVRAAESAPARPLRRRRTIGWR